jgi:hypothetical protein
MSKFFRFLMLVSLTFGLIACGDDNNEETPAVPTLSISAADKSVSFEKDAGSKTIVVTASEGQFTATVEADKSWCTVSDITQSLFKINVTENTDAEARTAKITVSLTGAESVEITVTQAPTVVELPAAVLMVHPHMFTFDTPLAGEKLTTVTTNRPTYTATVEAGKTWVTTEINGETLKIKVEASEVEAERSATITVHVDGATDVVLTVTQAAYVPPIVAPAATAKWTIESPGNLEWYKWEANKSIGTLAGTAPATIAGPGGVQAWALTKGDHVKVTNPLAVPTSAYTLLWDIRVADFSNYHPLLQTKQDNNDGDADNFIDKSGKIGQGDYSSTGVSVNTWHRIVITVDVQNNIETFYLDGNRVGKKDLNNDDKKNRLMLQEFFWVFLDDDNEDEAIDCAAIAIWDTVLSEGEVADLGTAETSFK